ncbi:MAG TPA: serine hydrolase [Hyphomicrobiaceae bacterium]|nr:serine hydrolase [Hyphomicrobiaceae bacterium]
MVALVRLVLAAGIVCLTAGPHSEAAAAGRYASLVVDANTGRVLHAQAADEPRYPASLTKMMTLYIVFELLEQHRLEPQTRIRISEAAANTPPSRLGLDAGSEITVGDAIRALITKSANDIAVALAEHIAGSEAKFARIMTQKARALGMSATVFKNPHGLPDPDQVTTARDMVTLALHLYDDFPRYYPLFSIRAFHYGGKSFRNHNTLLGSFEGVDGIKTGYTAASGFNIVTSVRRDGKHVVGVVFGGSSAASRNVLMRALLRRSIAEASTVKTRKPVLVARAAERRSAERQAAQRPERYVVARPAEPAARSIGEIARHNSAPEPLQATKQPEEAPVLKGPPIEIARVRPVLVAPRARVAQAEPVSQSAAISRTTADAGALPMLSRAVAEPGSQGGRGALPSSLEAQADRLSRGQPPVTPAVTSALAHRSQAPAPTQISAPFAGRGGFAVQVGAYSTQAEAMRQLQAASARAGDLLAGRPPVSQPVQHAGKQLYRARFSGFDSQTANATCQELKRRQIECHVAKVE